MIAYLKGTILAHTKDGAIIGTDSLGYEVIGLWLGQHPVGDSITLWTYQYFENEQIPRLIGCSSPEARDFLIQLLAVSGVGPKMASRIVGRGDITKIKTAIMTGDLEILGTIKGLGKKTAQKIILELGKTLVSSESSGNVYLYEALSQLGFTKSEIDTALSHTSIDGLTESAALSVILKNLGKK